MPISPPTPRNPLTLALWASLWLASGANWPLWQALTQLPEMTTARGAVTLAGFFVMVAAVIFLLLALFAWRRTIKPAIALFLFAAAAGAYFMGTYGVVIDATMMVNVLHTDPREVRDLLSLGLLGHFVVLALLPLLWLWRVPVAAADLHRQLGRNALGLVAALLVMGLTAFALFADLSATMRNHKSLRYRVNPVNSFYALGMVTYEANARRRGPPQAIGLDAKLLERPAGAKPPLLLLVIGETARAPNFSLNGYARKTNPELETLDVVSFRDATSCGTSTAASLPCMVSHLGREAYTARKGDHENLLDLLQRAGLAVLWLDNQSGCKGLCERIPNAYARDPAPGTAAHPAGLCRSDGECLDETLLLGLDQRLAALPAERRAKGVVLVLHQMGSHGPAYWLRSPENRKPFQPECTTNLLQHCGREELVNAYDNTIAYTDHVLAGGIAWLKKQAGYAPSMLYVSDHGESLGENNLYLHGIPYALAPRVQTHVPFIAWTPDGALRACLKAKRDQPISHDHLFHMVLGTVGVRAAEYQPKLDLIGNCKAPG